MDDVYILQYGSVDKETKSAKTFVGSAVFADYNKAEDYLTDRGYTILLERDGHMPAYFTSDTPYHIMSATILERKVIA